MMSCVVDGGLLVTVDKTQVDTKLKCTVCYDEFNIDDKALKFPCSHLFHEACISNWLRQRSTCPNCRTILVRDEPQDDDDVIALSEDEQDTFLELDEAEYDSDADNDFVVDFEVTLNDMSSDEQVEELEDDQGISDIDLVSESEMSLISLSSEDMIQTESADDEDSDVVDTSDMEVSDESVGSIVFSTSLWEISRIEEVTVNSTLELED